MIEVCRSFVFEIMTLWWVIGLLAGIVVGVVAEENYIEVNGPLVRTVGESVNLTCKSFVRDDYPVLWLKLTDDPWPEDQVFISTGGNLISHKGWKDERYEIFVDPSSATYTFRIKDLKLTDSGRYRCEVIFTVTRRQTKDVVLKVAENPKLSNSLV